MTASSERDSSLEIGLLAIRITCAGLFLVWSIDKIIHPEHAALVFKTFYFSQISEQIAIGIGAVQTAFVLAFLIGAFKTWTYGGLLVMHTISVFSTWEKLLTPYAGNRQILFWGAVPVVAALLLLFLVRKRDRLWSV
ncbi:MAG: DoxX protein [Hyphomicrobiaceae bacterium]|nr:hypothetical protein [Hyphomicrobiaceae bacterium]MCC0007952.1 DoxX protein [Hyphomicrobiaceae bacterium]